MRKWTNPARWPVTVKTPLLVAALMVAISVVISQQVLSRLVDTQERHLKALAATYMDGLAASLLPAVLREDIWESFAVIDRARTTYRAIRPHITAVVLPDGQVLASSDPRSMPALKPLAKTFKDDFDPGRLVVDGKTSTAFMLKPLMYQGRRVGTIYSTYDVAHLIAERQSVQRTLLVTNAVLAAIFAIFGYWLVRRMMAPVQTLANHLRQDAEGFASEIPKEEFPANSREFSRLFAGYNRLVRAEREREALSARLADEKRLASLGRLASAMAHEINNPLGGMLNALTTLERHGERASVRRTSVSLLRRGLQGIRDVVATTLTTYRDRGDERPLNRSELDDLRLLIKPSVRRKRLQLDWRNEVRGEFAVSAGAVRQLALNLLLNACEAAPEDGRVEFMVDTAANRLRMIVRDNGSGFPAPALAYLCEADKIWSPPRKVKGLGLWMIRRLVEELGGKIKARNLDGGGAEVVVIIAASEERYRHVA